MPRMGVLRQDEGGDRDHSGRHLARRAVPSRQRQTKSRRVDDHACRCARDAAGVVALGREYEVNRHAARCCMAENADVKSADAPRGATAEIAVSGGQPRAFVISALSRSVAAISRSVRSPLSVGIGFICSAAWGSGDEAPSSQFPLAQVFPRCLVIDGGKTRWRVTQAVGIQAGSWRSVHRQRYRWTKESRRLLAALGKQGGFRI